MVSESTEQSHVGSETLPHKVGPNEDVRDLSGGDYDTPIWLCDVCGCVMSPTLGISWVDLGFLNDYKEPQLWLVLLRYSANVANTFPWVVTPHHLHYKQKQSTTTTKIQTRITNHKPKVDQLE